MTDGIIQQVFDKWINHKKNNITISPNQIRELQQELIEKIKQEFTYGVYGGYGLAIRKNLIGLSK